MESIDRASPSRLARIAGGLYLVNIVGGFFAIGVVPAVTVVAGDFAATAHNIQSNEVLFRLGLAAHVVITVTNIGLAAIFYELFKVLSRRLALVVVFLTLVGTAVESAGVLFQFVSLVLLGGGHYANALSATELQALAYLPTDLQSTSYDISTVFFGINCLVLGYLVFHSTFLPKVIGVLLAIDGLAYLVNSFSSIVSPGFAGHLVPYIQVPALFGEGSLCLWLLIAGVNSSRWEAVARRGRAPQVASPAGA